MTKFLYVGRVSGNVSADEYETENDIGKFFADAMKKVGPGGMITLEENKGIDTHWIRSKECNSIVVIYRLTL